MTFPQAGDQDLEAEVWDGHAFCSSTFTPGSLTARP